MLKNIEFRDQSSRADVAFHYLGYLQQILLMKEIQTGKRFINCLKYVWGYNKNFR